MTTATDPFAPFSSKDLVDIHNRLVHQLEGGKAVKRFSSSARAKQAVEEALDATGDQIIVLVEPDYKKRGSGSKRFPFYATGLLSSEYVARCEKAGFDSETARRDLRYDVQRGLIELISV